MRKHSSAGGGGPQELSMFDIRVEVAPYFLAMDRNRPLPKATGPWENNSRSLASIHCSGVNNEAKR